MYECARSCLPGRMWGRRFRTVSQILERPTFEQRTWYFSSCSSHSRYGSLGQHVHVNHKGVDQEPDCGIRYREDGGNWRERWRYVRCSASCRSRNTFVWGALALRLVGRLLSEPLCIMHWTCIEHTPNIYQVHSVVHGIILIVVVCKMICPTFIFRCVFVSCILCTRYCSIGIYDTSIQMWAIS